MRLTIARNGDRLVGRAHGKEAFQGAFDLRPVAETKLWITLNGALLTFVKNDKGEVTAVVHHETGLPDFTGKKVEKE